MRTVPHSRKSRKRGSRGNHRHRAQGAGRPAEDADRDHRAHRQRARRPAGLQHRRVGPGGAEPAVRQQRAARGQQLVVAGIHPRHRADGSDVHRRSGRRASTSTTCTSATPSAARWRCATSPIVQVLRGPQGTLFGRNTIGGAVLISTKDPGDDFGGEMRAEFGSDDLMDAPWRSTCRSARSSRRAFARHSPAGRLRHAARRHGSRRHRHVLRHVQGRLDAERIA